MAGTLGIGNRGPEIKGPNIEAPGQGRCYAELDRWGPGKLPQRPNGGCERAAQGNGAWLPNRPAKWLAKTRRYLPGSVAASDPYRSA
jgi:hypothetical protein